jgi:hypothetical protein
LPSDPRDHANVRFLAIGPVEPEALQSHSILADIEYAAIGKPLLKKLLVQMLPSEARNRGRLTSSPSVIDPEDWNPVPSGVIEKKAKASEFVLEFAKQIAVRSLNELADSTLKTRKRKQNLKLASAGHEAEDAVANVRCRGCTVEISVCSQGQVRGERPFAGVAVKCGERVGGWLETEDGAESRRFTPLCYAVNVAVLAEHERAGRRAIGAVGRGAEVMKYFEASPGFADPEENALVLAASIENAAIEESVHGIVAVQELVLAIRTKREELRKRFRGRELEQPLGICHAVVSDLCATIEVSV